MKVLLIVLSLSAVGFAASTVHLASRLHDLRSASAPTPTVADAYPVAHAPASHEISKQSRAAPASQAQTPGTTPRAAPSEPEESRGRQIQQEMSAAFMKRYQDPAQRAEMLRAEKASLRRVNRKLGEATGLSEEEADQLFELLARNQLEASAAVHACTLDRLCDIGNFNFPDGQRQQAEVAAFFGPDRYRKYRQFQESRPERQLVDQLRVRVIDSAALRNSEAEKLISALWEEKNQFLADARRRGVRVTAIDTGAGPVIMNANEQGRPRGLAPEMAEFQERINARAAQVLTPEQLKVFKELRDQAQRSVRPRTGPDGPPVRSQ